MITECGAEIVDDGLPDGEAVVHVLYECAGQGPTPGEALRALWARAVEMHARWARSYDRNGRTRPALRRVETQAERTRAGISAEIVCVGAASPAPRALTADEQQALRARRTDEDDREDYRRDLADLLALSDARAIGAERLAMAVPTIAAMVLDLDRRLRAIEGGG